MAVSYKREHKRSTYLLAAIIVALLLLLGWYYYTHPSGAGGAGGGTSTSTSTSPGAPTVVQLFPSGAVYNGFSLVYLPDYVTATSSGAYSLTLNGIGSVSAVAAIGGQFYNANITYGILAVTLDNTQFPIFGVASTNSTLNYQLSNGITLYLTSTGGYILYRLASGNIAAVYMAEQTFNVSNTKVYVWVPAQSYPSTLYSGAKYNIVVNYNPLTVYVNSQPYGYQLLKGLNYYTGVLYTWVVYGNQSGTYIFQLNS